MLIKTTQSYSDVYVTYTASVTDGSLSVTSKSKTGSLSGGPIAGIVVGSVSAVAIFIFILFWIWKARKGANDVENPEVAAAVVANKYSEKMGRFGINRFSNLSRYDGDDDDDDFIMAPAMGSTGEDNKYDSLNTKSSSQPRSSLATANNNSLQNDNDGNGNQEIKEDEDDDGIPSDSGDQQRLLNQRLVIMNPDN